MDSTHLVRKLVACSCALMLTLTIGITVPQMASAQEQGGTTPSNDSGGFGSVIRSIFGGGNNPGSGPTGDGSSNLGGTGGVPSNPFGNWFGGGSTPAPTGGGSTNDSSNPISGFVNWVIDSAINFRNENNMWSNEGGNSIINGIQDAVGSLITGTVNVLTGEVTGTDEGTNANGGQGPLDITPGGSDTSTDSDDNTGSGRPGDATGGSRGHNPSGLGGLGSPSNPLGTGASDMDDGTSNSDEIGTNNVETQTSPYLFAPVPGGENNAGQHPN